MTANKFSEMVKHQLDIFVKDIPPTEEQDFRDWLDAWLYRLEQTKEEDFPSPGEHSN